MITDATLKKYGWRPIVSDKQAWQLLRRELKHHAKCRQRQVDRNWDYRTLLEIKKGNWFTFIGNPQNDQCSIAIWIRPVR